MNLHRLASTIANFQKAIQAVLARGEELEAELSQIRENPDPFARHVYQARRDYARTMASDRTKHGRHAEYTFAAGYRQACELGYRGSREQWHLVLTAWVSTKPEPATPNSAETPQN